MLSASPSPDSLICHPNLTYLAATGPAGLSPAQVLHAYGFDQVSWKGLGETIAIVDACDDPTVAADLHAFDLQFGLADPKLTVTKLSLGGMTPTYDSQWALEISLDVEWAHAIAPKANIMLVEAPNASLGSLLFAVDYARTQPGVGVVSMSWGGPEFNGEGTYDSHFTTPAGHGNVTFVASSGDSGAPASWPSISNNVLSVGGTTLSIGANGNYAGEAAWSRSGGGYSLYEPEPSYQRSVQTTGQRSNPDVAFDADPGSGFAVYDNGSWCVVGGTSAGAPQWAGLIARVNQARVAAGKSRLSSAPQAIYSMPKADFHDITTGNNGYAAGPGYDAATGRGSPIAQCVIRDLIAYKLPAAAAVKTSAVSLATLSSSAADQFLETGNGVASPVQTTWTLPAAVVPGFADVSSLLGDSATMTSTASSSFDEGMSSASPETADALKPSRTDSEFASLAAGMFGDWSRSERLIGDSGDLSGASTGASDESLDRNLIDACFADLNYLVGEPGLAA